MSNIQVRIATENDAPVLARFRYELRSSAGKMIESDAQFIERCTLWMRERLCSGSSWGCWIAESDEVACGSIWAQLIEKIPNPVVESECYIYITNFYVREGYRGQGIGSRLLSEALAWGKTKDAHTAILWPRERSKSLYVRHGFTVADDLMRVVITPKE